MKVFVIIFAVLAVASAQMTTPDGFVKAIQGLCTNIGPAQTANANARTQTTPVAQQTYQPVLNALMYVCNLGQVVSPMTSGSALAQLPALEYIPVQLLADLQQVAQFLVQFNIANAGALQQNVVSLQMIVTTLANQLQSLQTSGAIQGSNGILNAIDPNLMSSILNFATNAVNLMNQLVVALYA